MTLPLKIIATLVFLVVLLFCSALIYVTPDCTVSIILFKIYYSVPSARYSFLELYSPWRRQVDNGKIPPEIDDLLCESLETSEDRDEIAAIVNFYAVQSSGRRGILVLKRSEKTQEKIAAELIRQIEARDDYLFEKMAFLEEIRTGKSLYKGGIRFDKFDSRGISELQPKEERIKWFEENTNAVISDLTRWWNTDLQWKEKRKLNPLKNSRAKFEECCG